MMCSIEQLYNQLNYESFWMRRRCNEMEFLLYQNGKLIEFLMSDKWNLRQNSLFFFFALLIREANLKFKMEYIFSIRLIKET
jgi:hypothetical protein